jgi:VWA domain-containing protein
MTPTTIAALIGASILVLAITFFWLTRSRRRQRSAASGAAQTGALIEILHDALHFMMGPLPLSISLHVAVLLGLLWGVHIEQARNLIMVKLQAGGVRGGGSSSDNLKALEMPEMPMPQTAPLPIERPVVATHSSETVSAATHYVRSVMGTGIGAGRGGGIGSGYGRGIGAGFGGFIGGLRRTGLEVTIVIDGTGSMSLIINDVKAKMQQLVLTIHRLVPIARIGIVVFGGRGEPIQVVQMTVSPDKLIYFLNNIQAHNGGEWQEDTLGAVRTAVDRMGWTPAAKKVIVLVGDTPPFDEDAEPVLEEVRKFRMEDGTFNTVDVTVEEHERFVEDWNRRNFDNMSPKGPLPAFYLQTQNAYRTMAAAGNGSWHSLTKEQQINQQVLMLVFGEEWRREVATFGRGITSPSPDP